MTKMLIGTEKDYQNIIIKAKKEVFDWIAKQNTNLGGTIIHIPYDEFIEEEKHHLSTFPKKEKETNNDFIQDCLNNLSDFWIDADGNLCYRQKCLGKVKQS